MIARVPDVVVKEMHVCVTRLHADIENIDNQYRNNKKERCLRRTPLVDVWSTT